MNNHQPELISKIHSEISEVEKEQKEEYRRQLAEYLKDPAFRAIVGFPIGTDKDILAVSDPPYYTACPNPFLPEIIEKWQQEREEIRGDLTNEFNRKMNRGKHEQPLELVEILEQNFLEDPDGKWYVPDHNKATDLEKVRQRSLLKEFNEYAYSSGRLRVFRSEAVRAGFADGFKRQDYETIVKVTERLPEDVLREDPDLLMYYDSALLRK